MTEPLASRAFTIEDQRAFALMSRDRNPIHLDASFARRTQAGAAIVHRDSHAAVGNGCSVAVVFL